jgi:DNA-directed RNA polymerase subunit beta
MVHTFESIMSTNKIISKRNLPKPAIPDLVALQYGSFQKFLIQGINEALTDITPITCTYGIHKLTISFFPDQLQFRNPDENEQNAIFTGKTYGCSVYVPALISNTQWNEPKIEWLLLGFLPLMSPSGHFIINGIPRIVLHQMVRNPGIYILPNDSRTRVPTIRIVPQQGSWLNITIDKKNRLWITTRLLRRKISLIIFLQALGISIPELYSRIEQSHMLQFSFIRDQKGQEKTRHGRILDRAKLNSHPKTQIEAIRYIYSHIQEYTTLGRDQVVNSQTSQEFFNSILWSPKNRDLGNIGRQQFKQKFNSTISSDQTLLCGDDLVYATDALLKLVAGEIEGDDIDSLNNKRIRGCGDLLQDQLVRGLREFETVMARKLNLSLQNDAETIWKLQKSNLAKSVSKSWKSFFTSGTLSQFLDETNPLAEVTHKRRITVLGPGGVSSKQTTIQIRGIHPTYYGRLCPIETPEGQNAGLVNSLTVYARPNKLGHIETPFYKVYKGQIQQFLNPKYNIPFNEANYLVAPADINSSNTGMLPNMKLPNRKNWKFGYSHYKEITNKSVGTLQMISVATSLIPFLEHDDANRALMGSNMQRQAVPLIGSEPAYVQTGLESRVISDVQHSLNSSVSGYITNVSGRSIEIFTPNSDTQFSKPSFNNSIHVKHHLKRKQIHSFIQTKQNCDFSSTANLVSANTKLNEQVNSFTDTTQSLKRIVLEQYNRTNQSTPKLQRPIIKSGEWVQKSNILADGAASSQGKIALGKNILVAYVPWEGYNFEDAILISDRLVKEDIFTSLHIDYYEIEVKNTQHGLEQITNKIPIEFTESEEEILRIQRLQDNGFIPIGTWVTEGDYLIGKVTPTSPKVQSVQQQYEKLYNVLMERDTGINTEQGNVRDTSLRVPKGVEGFVYDINVLPPKEAEVIAIAPKDAILRVRVALLHKRRIQVGDKMAGRHGNKGIVSNIIPSYDMPYLPDGRPVDIVLNPLGVPSRMNVGQILECLLGLAGNYLNESYLINLFDEQYGSEASRSFVYYKLLEASIKTGQSWLFEPHHPGKVKLFDGRTGTAFDQPVTVGCTYMLKLVHQVDDKLHARSTGPYSAITQQPVRGRSRNGGQRLGEMEVWALQAYGASIILQEFLTIKSDDVRGRVEAAFQIHTNQPIQFGTPESFRVLIRELQALCFNLKLFSIHENSGLLKSVDFNQIETMASKNN